MKETIPVKITLDNGLVETIIEANVTFDIEDVSFDHAFGVHKAMSLDTSHPEVDITRYERMSPWGTSKVVPTGERLKEIEQELISEALEGL